MSTKSVLRQEYMLPINKTMSCLASLSLSPLLSQSLSLSLFLPSLSLSLSLLSDHTIISLSFSLSLSPPSQSLSFSLFFFLFFSPRKRENIPGQKGKRERLKPHVSLDIHTAHTRKDCPVGLTPLASHMCCRNLFVGTHGLTILTDVFYLCNRNLPMVY